MRPKRTGAPRQRQTKKKPGRSSTGLLLEFRGCLEVAHATHAARWHGRHGLLGLGLVGDYDLGRQDHAADRSGVLDGGAGHLRWVDDAALEHVGVLAG